jgi:uncharacterized lipoprotein
MRIFLKSAVSLAAVLLASGCALVEDTIPVAYTAPANISVTPGANAVTLDVTSADGRASNRDRVSTKKNGYGMEMAKILASNDVVAEVGNAVRVELQSLGFTIGQGGIVVKVETTTFYNDFKNGFFSGDAVAEVSFNLTAKKPDGDLVYSRSYKAVGINKDILMAAGSTAQPALETALREAIQQVVADRDLHRALVKAGAKPQAVSTAAPTS